MARNIHGRIRLKGKLVARSPLHVGGFGEEVETDLPLARNGAGRHYVPGTGLAGALRSLTERLFGAATAKEFWGDQRDDTGHASLVVIEDAEIHDDEKVVVEIRDGVGIDRETGAAAEHIKYDRAVLPRGTTWPLELAVDVRSSADRPKALAMVAALRNELVKGNVRLGAAKTRGLGRVELQDASLTGENFGSRRGILAVLRKPGGSAVEPKDVRDALTRFPPKLPAELNVTIDWQPIGPIMVKANHDGIAADMLPLVSGSAESGCDGKVALVLPGSSLKGALRSRAERIVRTMLNRSEPAWLLEENAKRRFLAAVELPLIDELFGQCGQKQAAEDSRAGDGPLPGRGALSVADCYGKQLLEPAKWAAVEGASNEAELRAALVDAGLEPWAHSHHVAIDRWLGSAAESMLFSVLEPHGTAWEPLTLEVDLERLPQALRSPALALLYLVLRDLARADLPLGFGTLRGLGAVRVTQLRQEGRGLPEELKALENLTLEGGRPSALPPATRAALDVAWQAWISRNTEHPAEAVR